MFRPPNLRWTLGGRQETPTPLLRAAVIAVVAFASVLADARDTSATTTSRLAASSSDERAPSESEIAAAPAPQAPAAPRLATWPIAGTITSPFGPRTGGLHNGLDIAAPMYTPVRAASPGVVQSAGTPYLSYGDTAQLVMIAHASNLSTLYAHLDSTAVRAGQSVQAGQIIGYVGVTGWTTGPHVHFITMYDGHAVDPLRFLP